MKPYYQDDWITIYNGDCLRIMPQIDDKSIDMILCDLPYGTTDCNWDIVIPFEPLWLQYKRIIKNNSVIVLTASQPFTSVLIMSNIEMFRYEWIWEKSLSGSPALCKKMPLKIHENICIFYKITPTYNPIMTIGKRREKVICGKSIEGQRFISQNLIKRNINNKYYPRSIKYFSNADRKNKLHPTQKPIELFKYLIKTYTNEGNLILDNCLGSGTTARACKDLQRRCIGIEISKTYCDIAVKRLGQELLDFSGLSND